MQKLFQDVFVFNEAICFARQQDRTVQSSIVQAGKKMEKDGQDEKVYLAEV